MADSEFQNRVHSTNRKIRAKLTEEGTAGRSGDGGIVHERDCSASTRAACNAKPIIAHPCTDMQHKPAGVTRRRVAHSVYHRAISRGRQEVVSIDIRGTLTWKGVGGRGGCRRSVKRCDKKMAKFHKV